MRITLRRLVLPVSAVLALGLAQALPSTAAAPAAHGGTIVSLNANQSSNWSGYNQGTLEQGGKLFNQVSAVWTVPTATQHKRGQAESSSVWVGIGGGCVDADCLVGDNTLIQAGTEQDVAKNGKASYSAWWEIIPGPSVTISNFPVKPGDSMFVDIKETVPDSNVWVITVTDRTAGHTFTQTLPYSSTHATAEWIVETPLSFGTGGVGLTALPNLGKVHFDTAKANGVNAGLKASEGIQLIDTNGRVIAAPSVPDAQHDGFYDCTWATTC